MSVIVPLRFSSKQEASLVEVAGSYNNWTTAAMTKNPESPEDWTISLNLNPGTHQYKFIVDGDWKHDSECVTTDDNKGGLNNIITVAGDLSNEDLQFLVNTTDKSEEEVKDYYKLFKMRHPTGNIDMKEYKKMTTRFIKKITSKCDPDVVCDYAFKSYDKDGNGFISFREACHAMYVNRDGGSKEEKAKYSFHMYDINKSGTIEKKELYDWIIGIFVLHGEKLGKDDLAKLEIETEEKIGQLDTNKDGVISEEEFVSGCIKDDSLFNTLCCYQEFLVEILQYELELLEMQQDIQELEKETEDCCIM